jgi:alkylation response protein AidB-like acyl-CoA dehydrogenase
MEAIMDFEHSPKVKALQRRLNDFMAEHIYPNEQRYQHELRSGDRWQPTVVIEELKRKARAAGLGTCSCPSRAWRRTNQSRIRAAVRDHGPRRLGGRGLQLLGA